MKNVNTKDMDFNKKNSRHYHLREVKNAHQIRILTTNWKKFSKIQKTFPIRGFKKTLEI